MTVLSLPDDQQPQRETVPAAGRIYQLRPAGQPAARPLGGNSAGRKLKQGEESDRFRAKGRLTNRQIIVLKKAGTFAFRKQLEAGKITIPASSCKTTVQNDWLHAQQLAATGHRSLKQCNNGDFRPLMAHYAAQAGYDDHAFRLLMKTGEQGGTQGKEGDTREDIEMAMNHLRRTLNQFKKHISMGYAEAICRRQFRVGLDGATARQILAIRNTCHSRGQAKEISGPPKFQGQPTNPAAAELRRPLESLGSDERGADTLPF